MTEEKVVTVPLVVEVDIRTTGDPIKDRQAAQKWLVKVLDDAFDSGDCPEQIWDAEVEEVGE